MAVDTGKKAEAKIECVRECSKKEMLKGRDAASSMLACVDTCKRKRKPRKKRKKSK